MKPTFYLIVLALLSTSSYKMQQIKNQRLTGCYLNKIKNSFVGSTIDLYENNSFTYHWTEGLLNGTTTGTWKRVRNKLILNSDKQPKKRYFKLTNNEKTEKNEFEIMIVDELNDTHIGASCILMKDSIMIKGTISNFDGVCYLPFSQDANKIIISYTGYKTAIFSPDSLSSNSIIIELEPEEYYEYFTNREWKIRRRKLIAPEMKGKLFSGDHLFKKVKK